MCGWNAASYNDGASTTGMVADIYYMTKIYELTTEEGGIRYVGQTVSKLTKRKNGHVRTALVIKNNTHVSNWIRSEYAKGKTILIRLIEECEGEVGNYKEEYWIKEYKARGIRLTNTQPVGVRNYKPGIVKWTEEQKVEIGKRSKTAMKALGINQPVILYNLDGKFHKEFDSVGGGLKYVGANGDHSGVKKCADGVYGQVYGYIWRYKTGDYPLQIPAYQNKRWRIVEQLALDGEPIRKFTSIIDATSTLKLSESERKHISAVCNGKRNSCAGFKWRYC